MTLTDSLGCGMMLGGWPIVVASAIALLLAATILTMKLVLGGRDSP